MGKCTEGVISSAKDVVVLAFDLGKETVLDSPDLLAKVLDDSALQKAVRKALLEEGKRLAKLQRQGKSADDPQGIKVLQRLGNAAKSPAEKAVRKEIEKSKEYRRVQEGLKNLECSFKNSPMGVFVDENKGLLIVLASGIALGGAAALYVARSGDWPANQLASLAGEQLRFKVLGNIELGAKKVAFKPSERKVELTTFTTAKWKRVQANLDLHVGFKDDKLATASSKGQVVVQVAQGAKLRASGAVGYVDPQDPAHRPLTYDLGVGISFTGDGPQARLKLQMLGFVRQTPANRSVGGEAKLDYRLAGPGGDKPSLHLTAGAKASRVETFQAIGPATTTQSFETNVGIELRLF